MRAFMAIKGEKKAYGGSRVLTNEAGGRADE